MCLNLIHNISSSARRVGMRRRKNYREERKRDKRQETKGERKIGVGEECSNIWKYEYLQLLFYQFMTKCDTFQLT